MKNRFQIIIVTSIVFFNLSFLHAQNWEMTVKLGSADQIAGDNLGISTWISDTFMIAGAWWEDGETDTSGFVNSAGAAYIYQLQSDGQWEQTQKLVSPNAEALGYFGFNVAIENDYALVGAYNEDHSGMVNAGRVYVYQRTNDDLFTLEDVLMAPAPEDGDTFGRNVGLTTGYALIGSHNHSYDENGANFMDGAGAAYLFKRGDNGTWSMIEKLVAIDREPGDNFGKYVDIDNLGLVIGAFNKNESLSLFETGAAYGAYCNDSLIIWGYDNLTSSDLIQFKASDQDNFENFGWDVAISGKWAVVGKSSESDLPNGQGESNVGAAYFFYWENGGWVEKQKVYASDLSPNAHFGRSIGIHDKICVIGAGGEQRDEMGNNPVFMAGAAYVFELQDNGEWQEVQKLAGTNRSPGDLFGEDAVSVHGTHIVVGAWLADTIASNTVLNDGGAVYVFERDGPIVSAVSSIPKISNIEIINNPSFGFLQLKNGGKDPFSTTLRIYSTKGPLLFEEQFYFQEYWETNLSHLSPGLYFLQFHREGFYPLSLPWVKF